LVENKEICNTKRKCIILEFVRSGFWIENYTKDKKENIKYIKIVIQNECCG